MIAGFLFCLLMPTQWLGAVYGAEMGPLHVRQRYPLYLMFLMPEPDSPRQVEKGSFLASVSTDYTSIYINESNQDWSVLMDMEATVVDLSLTYGVTKQGNVSLTLPWISLNGGFLDGPLEVYHGFFGFPDYGRGEAPSDEFGYHVTLDGDAWFDARPGGMQLGESVVTVKWQLTEAGIHKGLGSSLLYALKIPTGDEERGLGSGRFDQGFILLNQYSIAPLVLYLNPGIVFLSDPVTKGAHIQVKDMVTLLAGIEYQVSDTWSWMGQVNFLTSPFHHTGIEQMDRDSLELTLGGVIRVSDQMVFELAFSEDVTRTAPDFTVHGSLRYEFGS